MINGPLLKNIILFAVPVMFSSLLQILFNAADTVIVGKFAGEQALAAVGATGSLIFMLTSLFNGTAMGANVIVSRNIGANDAVRVERSVHTSICVSLIGGVILTAIGTIFAPGLLRLMNTPEAFIHLSVRYMRIYFVGTISMLVYNFGSAILRSKGDTRRPLIYLAIAGVLNVLLNLLTVIVLKMGVAGVAIATVVSQTLSAVLTIRALVKDDDATHLDLRKLHIDGLSLKELLRIGIPAGIQGVVFAISNVVVQSSINSFNSTSIVAGNAAGANIEGFVYIGCSSFSNACVTFMSQNMGARRYDRLLKVFSLTLVLTAVAAGGLSLLVFLNGRTLLGLYTDSAQAVDAGMTRTTYVALWLFLKGILDIFVSSLRGMGYSMMPTAIMIAGICGFRLGWLWTVFRAQRTLETIYLCFPLSWIITSVIEGVMFVFAYRKVRRRNDRPVA